MAKEKVEKTNALRLLDRMKIPYEAHAYPCQEFSGGEDVARQLGLDPADVCKTLVTVGKSGGHYVFVLPVSGELDRKKAEKKAERWQTIALGAAKQSKRMQIPTVHMPVTFQQALAMMAESDVRLMPYENAEGMEGTRKILESIEPGESIAILIGPEGGIDEAEVEMAMKEKVEPITLGKRILRTETAGMTVLSILVYLLEGRERTR